MNVTVNNEEITLDGSITVEELIHQLNIQENRIAVEINREIVPRSQYTSCKIRENDQIEVVNAVGGG